MANHYTHFAVAIAVTQEQREFFQRIAAHLEQIGDDDGPDEAPADLKDICETLVARYKENGCGPGCDSTYEDGTLYISDDCGEPNIDMLADIFAEMVKRFDMKPVIFEWAFTCSKPRPGGFGGGAALITKDGIHWMNTDAWALEKLKSLDGPAPELAKDAALRGALPWLSLLGDYIGNGVMADKMNHGTPLGPTGRCDAISAIHDALAAKPPTLAIMVDGGLVQGLVSDQPKAFAGVKVMSIDYDVQDGSFLIPQDEGKAPARAHVCEWEIEQATDLSGIREMSDAELDAEQA